VDDLVDFVRGPGFVLDFSDTSFADFFASELKVNINDAKYSANGGSKGKRLRYFLQSCDDATALRTPDRPLGAPLGIPRPYWPQGPVVNAEARYQGLVNRLSGGVAPQPAAHSAAT
jgi:hypothetical protein